MKKIVIVLSTTILVLFALSIALLFVLNSYNDKLASSNKQIGELSSENESLKEENNTLQNQLSELTSNKTEFKRVTVVNNFWEYSIGREALYGNIFFDDLSIVKNITVSYIDEVFNVLSPNDTSICIDSVQNKAVVSCLIEDTFARACVLEVEYIDGRTESIYVCICMG